MRNQLMIVKKLIVYAIGIIIVQWLFASCKSNNKNLLFVDYKVSDTLNNGGFYFERNNIIDYEEKKFYKFRLRLGRTHTELYGYLASVGNSLFLYYPELN